MQIAFCVCTWTQSWPWPWPWAISGAELVHVHGYARAHEENRGVHPIQFEPDALYESIERLLSLLPRAFEAARGC
jgi:hypothetical protein